jgi:hypothetical protein
MLARAANLDEFPGHDSKFRHQAIWQFYPNPAKKKAAIEKLATLIFPACVALPGAILASVEDLLGQGVGQGKGYMLPFCKVGIKGRHRGVVSTIRITIFL